MSEYQLLKSDSVPWSLLITRQFFVIASLMHYILVWEWRWCRSDFVSLHQMTGIKIDHLCCHCCVQTCSAISYKQQPVYVSSQTTFWHAIECRACTMRISALKDLHEGSRAGETSLSLIDSTFSQRQNGRAPGIIKLINQLPVTKLGCVPCRKYLIFVRLPVAKCQWFGVDIGDDRTLEPAAITPIHMWPAKWLVL